MSLGLHKENLLQAEMQLAMLCQLLKGTKLDANRLWPKVRLSYQAKLYLKFPAGDSLMSVRALVSMLMICRGQAFHQMSQRYISHELSCPNFILRLCLRLWVT